MGTQLINLELFPTLNLSGEIRRLAFMNWQKAGSPPGRFLSYWLEAESEIIVARRHLSKVVDTPGKEQAMINLASSDDGQTRPAEGENPEQQKI